MSSASKRAPTLYLIVAFKLVRGIFFLAIAVEAFRLVGKDLRPGFESAVRWARLDPETDFFDRVGDRIDAITPANVRWVATGALLYGLLSLAEGAGLARRARWAGLLVVAESAFFVPVEAYALVKDFDVAIALILALNVAIVVYLHRNRDRLLRHA